MEDVLAKLKDNLSSRMSDMPDEKFQMMKQINRAKDLLRADKVKELGRNPTSAELAQLNKEVDEVEQQNQWSRMKDFIEPLDKYRNRNVFDYLPYMTKYWNL